jgi:methionyl-tRNA formyltransferase
MTLRIVFFGLPLAALLLAEDGHEVELAAICRNDAVGLRRLARRLGPERMWMKPSAGDPALRAHVEAIQPDLVVSWFWTTRLPMEIVRAARLGAIGAHPSLLPRHRGPDPTYWAIVSGDTETGVTVHRIEEDYDTGAILGQATLPIDPHWNAWQLARALDRPSLRLLRETVRRLSEGAHVPERIQDPRLATTAPFPDDEDCALNWRWPTARVLRHVRALAPAPGAWTELLGRTLTILRAEPVTSFFPGLEPGEGMVVDGTPIIRTADSAIAVRGAELDGHAASTENVIDLFSKRARLVIG